jgi:hypothetical protein
VAPIQGARLGAYLIEGDFLTPLEDAAGDWREERRVLGRYAERVEALA